MPLRRRWRFDASTLAARRFPALQWAVKDVLPEGLCILGGKPKMGKSWMALQIAIEIARGGTVFGSVPVERGNVLYLALEDTARRLRDRQEKLLGGDPPFDLRERLDLWLECPKLNDGGMEQLEEWLKGHPRARLVIVDTLKRIRPRAGGGSVYDEDYDALSPLADLAHRHHVCLLVVHHLRKAEAEDPIDALSGSTGLTGAPDGIVVLRRVRGQADAELWVVHREGEETELALRFDSSTARWSLIGAAEEYRLSRERRSILDTLTEFGPQTPKDIAEALGRNRSSIRALLAKMHRAGEVTKDKDGRYLLPVAVLPGAAEGGNCQDPPVEAKSA